LINVGVVKSWLRLLLVTLSGGAGDGAPKREVGGGSALRRERRRGEGAARRQAFSLDRRDNARRKRDRGYENGGLTVHLLKGMRDKAGPPFMDGRGAGSILGDRGAGGHGLGCLGGLRGDGVGGIPE
jgi:hypothetical protein